MFNKKVLILLLTHLYLILGITQVYQDNIEIDILNIDPDMSITIDMYSAGGDGNTNGQGGASGAFIRAIAYSTELHLSISNDGTYVFSPDRTTDLNLSPAIGIIPGIVISSISDEIIHALDGNLGGSNLYLNRPNSNSCLNGCQGRYCNQQIIPGNGGLAPESISLLGTIQENPIYMDGDRYKDDYYTTNLLNCCGKNQGSCNYVKCATECAKSVNGGPGNGGSGSYMAPLSVCGSTTYSYLYNCEAGKGGNGYIKITYSSTIPEYSVCLLCILSVIFLVVGASTFILVVIHIIMKSNTKKEYQIPDILSIDEPIPDISP